MPGRSEPPTGKAALATGAAPDGESEAAFTQLHSVIDHAPIVLWAVDHEGRFTLSEGRGLKPLGLRPGQVVGMSAFKIYEANPDILAALHRALAGEDVEVVFTAAGRTFENRIVPIRREDDRVTEILGVSIDVTERNEAERERANLQAQLLQVQKLESLGMLAGGIAHDFNNILTIIETGTSIAQMSLPPGAPAHEDLEKVLVAARRAADLTRQLLAYSGRAPFEIKLVYLSRQIREISSLLAVTISKKVELRLEFASFLPPIKADVVQLQQVIMNLVINAAEAIGSATGQVTIATGAQELGNTNRRGLFVTEGMAPGRYVFMEVRDTGCGMDDITKAKIFDPFFTTKFTGRGLGLSAVLGIVRAHGGALSVESAPDQGTTFRVFFPAQSGAATSTVGSPGVEITPGGLALVIDDEAPIRSVTRRVLEMTGLRVIEAEDGRRGLARFRERIDEVDVVILDLTMPEMGGEETFRELRKLRANVPVLLMSGYTEQEASAAFSSPVLAGFLQKPFNASQLVQKVGAVLAVNDAAQPNAIQR